MNTSYDALLIVSFGGPEGPDDVMPFLEDVTFGKNVPRARLIEVTRHYERFGGVSPINEQVRVLTDAVADEFKAHEIRLPIYWGNRHWRPYLSETLRRMADDGVRRALALVTSAFGSRSGCQQYVEAITAARRQVGPAAPEVDKLRLFYNHPGFIEATAARTGAALAEIPEAERSSARLLFTAHSLPVEQAERSPYVRQLRESCQLVAGAMRGERREERGEGATAGLSSSAEQPIVHSTAGQASSGTHAGTMRWELVYQSRSGPPRQPWLEPDIRDYIRTLHEERGVKHLVVSPIGFLVENMEVAYDLDVEVSELCDELGVKMVRAAVAGGHPRLVQMVRELVVERLDPSAERLSLGAFGPWPDKCPADCCR